MESQQCYFSYVPTTFTKNILKEEEEKTMTLMLCSQISIDVQLSVSHVAKSSVLVCTPQDRKMSSTIFVLGKVADIL
jgi:hypothetical protein